MSLISPLQPIQNIPRPEKLSAPAQGDSAGAFRALLDQSVRAVSEQESQASGAVDQFLSGEQEDPHKMMLAVQRANLSFDLFVQVRNKVLQAYQEVMRMPE